MIIKTLPDTEDFIHRHEVVEHSLLYAVAQRTWDGSWTCNCRSPHCVHLLFVLKGVFEELRLQCSQSRETVNPNYERLIRKAHKVQDDILRVKKGRRDHATACDNRCEKKS